MITRSLGVSVIMGFETSRCSAERRMWIIRLVDLSGLFLVWQATYFDGLSFDHDITQVSVITSVIGVADEVIDLGFEIAGQIVVLQPDAALVRQVPALDLASMSLLLSIASDAPWRD